jgi:DNA-binding CsgD family transcriptional regulator
MPDNHTHHGAPAFGTPLRSPSTHPLEPSELNLLRMALNQMDYGLVVIDSDTALVQFANALGHAALLECPDGSGTLGRGSGLRLLHGRVMAQRPSDNETFRRTLERARAGLRGFLCLGEGTQSAAIAVLPLIGQRSAADMQMHGTLGSALPPAYALLVFSKQQLCDDSTMALFARERGLTSAEGQVLAQVCKGLRPAQIAHNHGVRISTVRTQLRSIRMKTCCETIRDLVQKVSVLPPMARQLSGQARN